MNTNEQYGQVGAQVMVNYWLVMPIFILLAANTLFNIAIADWSEAILSCLAIVMGLILIEKEKAVASLIIVNRNLQSALIKTLEEVVKLKGEDNGRKTEVSRD